MKILPIGIQTFPEMGDSEVLGNGINEILAWIPHEMLGENDYNFTLAVFFGG
jgi:hypothetical protein